MYCGFLLLGGAKRLHLKCSGFLACCLPFYSMSGACSAGRRYGQWRKIIPPSRLVTLQWWSSTWIRFAAATTSNRNRPRCGYELAKNIKQSAHDLHRNCLPNRFSVVSGELAGHSAVDCRRNRIDDGSTDNQPNQEL